MFAMTILKRDAQVLISVSTVLLELFGRLAKIEQQLRSINIVDTAGSIPNRNTLSLSDYFKHF